MKTQSKNPYIFVALIAALIISAVVGIEWLRRVGSPFAVNRASQTPSFTKGAPYPRTLRDGSGNALTVRARPERIASQTLGTDEILVAICEPKRIIAFSKLALDPKYSNVIAEARAIGAPSVQNAEEILQLNPDLIFVASYSRAETVQQLQAAGAPVFRFANFDRIPDIKENIRAVGFAIGNDERAEELIAQMERELARSRERVPKDDKRPRVMSYSPAGYTAGANTLFDDIIRTVGAVNVTAENNIDGFRKISAEQVAAWQPDFIISGGDTSKFDEVKRQLLAIPSIATTEAARRNRIIIMDNRYFLTVSHHVVRAVEALTNALYANSSEPAQ